MHDALKKVMQAALPRMCGASVMVADELLENGGYEKFTQYLRRQLAVKLADFIIESKVLDGADESCFTMVPDDKLAATRCEARLHVLTPKELEELVKSAFDAGVGVGRKAESYSPTGRTRPGDYVKIRKPWEKLEEQWWDAPPIKSELSPDQLRALLEGEWKKAFDEPVPVPGGYGPSKKGKNK